MPKESQGTEISSIEEKNRFPCYVKPVTAGFPFNQYFFTFLWSSLFPLYLSASLSLRPSPLARSRCPGPSWPGSSTCRSGISCFLCPRSRTPCLWRGIPPLGRPPQSSAGWNRRHWSHRRRLRSWTRLLPRAGSENWQWTSFVWDLPSCRHWRRRTFCQRGRKWNCDVLPFLWQNFFSLFLSLFLFFPSVHLPSFISLLF